MKDRIQEIFTTYPDDIIYVLSDGNIFLNKDKQTAYFYAQKYKIGIEEVKRNDSKTIVIDQQKVDQNLFTEVKADKNKKIK